MIKTWCYDVECLPNFFSVTITDLNDYLDKFKDCVDAKNKPIPIIQKISVDKTKQRLEQINKRKFYITDKDDSQLLEMIGFINSMRPQKVEGKIIRNHWFGYNSHSYDKLMIACLLMYVGITKTTKDLINELYETSKYIIRLQDDKAMFQSDYRINTLREYALPYTDIDVMKIFALNKVGAIIDNNGEKSYYGKSLKQTSINLQWYEILEYELPPISEKDAGLYREAKYKGFTIKQLNRYIDKWDRKIIDEWIPDMMHYNLNDVFIVCEMIRLYIDEIRLRYSISRAYEIDVLSSSRSKIADQLFIKFYSEFSGLSPVQWRGKKTERHGMSFNRIIFDKVKFKTKQLQDLLTKIKKTTVYGTGKDAFSEEVTINNLTYTLATGGIHSVDLPRELKSSDSVLSYDYSKGEEIWSCMSSNDYLYCHWDISSFYPNLMSTYEIAPEHLDKRTFTRLITWLKDTRIQAKHSKEALIDGIPKDILAQALKIVINSIYGKFSYKFGDTFDQLATLKVTINGQLFILMLCEELELNGIEVFSANTDGIVIKLYKKDKELFDNIAQNWQVYTGLSADSEYLKMYIDRDVNNYFCQEINNKFDFKGDLNPTLYKNDLSKGYNQPIVGQAVVNYFAYNKPIMETLYECKNILDFCKTQNVGRKFKVEYSNSINKVKVGKKYLYPYELTSGMGVKYKTFDHILSKEEIDKEKVYNIYEVEDIYEYTEPFITIQRNTRFYVSMNGGYLFKVDENGKRNNLCAGYKVTVLNTLDDEPIYNRNINYQYYYDEAMKIIDPIKLGISPNQKSDARRRIKSGKALIKKYSGDYGNLFEDNE